MVKRIIIKLICIKLGLRKYKRFQFKNQLNKATYYYFTKDSLVKIFSLYEDGKPVDSGVPLNYLLSDECKITKF